MGAYSYQALDPSGKTVKGILEGDSERHVRTLLRQRQLKPLEVRSTSQKRVRPGAEAAAPRKLFGGGGPKLGYKDIALVTRQLSSLLQSGLPLDEVLQAAATQSRKPTIKSLLLQVRA